MKCLRLYVSVTAIAFIWALAGGRCIMAQEPDVHAVADSMTSLKPVMQHSVGGVLRDLTKRAQIVFVGRVERIEADGGRIGVTFSIQQQVMGDVASSYTVWEWAGRWSGGRQHYREGQRAMVFLYAPSAAGLSSPVDGMAGIIPLIPTAANAEPLLDVRLLATRVERRVGAPIADADFGAVALADALAVVRNTDSVSLPEPIGRPLPIGLRPSPVRPLSDASSELGRSSLPSILQQPEAADVEH